MGLLDWIRSLLGIKEDPVPAPHGVDDPIRVEPPSAPDEQFGDWRSVREFMEWMIVKHEGGFQNDEEDNGNWVTMPDGTRRLVGTNMGVTPAALASWRGIEPWQVTREMILSLTMDEAVNLGVYDYYDAPGFDLLPWGPCVEIILDLSWHSGQVTAVRWLQRIVGADVDGRMGPQTAGMYRTWRQRLGAEEAAHALTDARVDHYDAILRRQPRKEKYRRGWMIRANWFRPTNTQWWGASA